MTIQDFIDDTARSVAFLSRVPVPQRHFIGHDGRLSRAVRAFPLAGVLIVLPAAALAAILSALHGPPLLVAFAALAGMPAIVKWPSAAGATGKARSPS